MTIIHTGTEQLNRCSSVEELRTRTLASYDLELRLKIVARVVSPVKNIERKLVPAGISSYFRENDPNAGIQ